MKDLNKKKFELDKDEFPDTDKSIKWAEKGMHTKLRNPNHFRDTFWYLNLSK